MWSKLTSSRRCWRQVGSSASTARNRPRSAVCMCMVFGTCSQSSQPSVRSGLPWSRSAVGALPVQPTRSESSEHRRRSSGCAMNSATQLPPIPRRRANPLSSKSRTDALSLPQIRRMAARYQVAKARVLWPEHRCFDPGHDKPGDRVAREVPKDGPKPHARFAAFAAPMQAPTAQLFGWASRFAELTHYAAPDTSPPEISRRSPRARSSPLGRAHRTPTGAGSFNQIPSRTRGAFPLTA
ncbi:hypothetical protein SAMN06265221_1531 [Paracoccus laeviglucosivorans]|uniref:Uncharacterized protein n=1 Tax=Paracoccus laeviglucosivorans TaxID=1197861 RepID=A0A521FUZ6_9RHOB|nr:hypothetical protein SAMN06265221_1531 [Paracoccus laeviglucosivorans]